MIYQPLVLYVACTDFLPELCRNCFQPGGYWRRRISIAEPARSQLPKLNHRWRKYLCHRFFNNQFVVLTHAAIVQPTPARIKFKIVSPLLVDSNSFLMHDNMNIISWIQERPIYDFDCKHHTRFKRTVENWFQSDTLEESKEKSVSANPVGSLW